MYYSVCDTDQRFDEDDQESLLNYCLDLDYFEDDDDGFRDYVREQYGSVEVCGYDFDALDILESDDYVYCEAKRDWANNELDNARDNAEYELRHATPGDTIWIGSYEVDVCEYEEEDEEEEEESDIQISIEATVNAQIELETKEREENKRRADSFESLFQFVG